MTEPTRSRCSALPVRDRRLAELSCLGAVGAGEALLDCVDSALAAGEVTLAELGEVSLQFAVYCGWPKGALLNHAVRRHWPRPGTESGAVLGAEPIRWNSDPEYGIDAWDRWLAGSSACFREVNHLDAPPRDTPFNDVGVLGFVFGHVWQRPGLTIRDRRIVAIACCAAVGATGPLKSHLHSARLSADLTEVELRELLDVVRVYVPRFTDVHAGLLDQQTT